MTAPAPLPVTSPLNTLIALRRLVLDAIEARDAASALPDPRPYGSLAPTAAELALLTAKARTAHALADAMTPERLLEIVQDAARWEVVRPGFFVSPHAIGPDTGVELMYGAHALDEVAAEMHADGALGLNDRAVAHDVRPVVDAVIATREADLAAGRDYRRPVALHAAAPRPRRTRLTQ